jgi:hypothetical protein
MRPGLLRVLGQVYGVENLDVARQLAQHAAEGSTIVAGHVSPSSVGTHRRAPLTSSE